PDNDTVRTDMLDYAFEIEHFDAHLGRMLAALDASGQLADTLVVVTADNGMPFPRVKGQEYEMSNHLPLAMMWPAGVAAPGRKIDDYVSFIDFAPTFLELAGVAWEAGGMQPAAGRSLSDIFKSDKSGVVDAKRDHVLIGKERHDVGRPHDQGYPVRGIVKQGKLYLENYEPARWPAGNPETGYLNTDGSPTKTVVLGGRTQTAAAKYWQWSFGKRPAEEFYDVAGDPLCLTNMAAQPARAAEMQALRAQMIAELQEQQDPRMFGRGAMFDEYPYADASGRGFYERYMGGEKLRAGWVSSTDFEKQPLD
ncbi:MAG: sulfatase-like hydrolase/transferase, partial [Planctomycetales bacterium]|nr:sulfatase-like hydrolase/transferase [Planctomycetales bacterium]